jgi:hypothetical protein
MDVSIVLHFVNLVEYCLYKLVTCGRATDGKVELYFL